MESQKDIAALTTIKLIELLVYVERLSNVFGRQFPGNFSGNSFLENAQNQSAPTKRSFVTSAETITSSEVNALVMPRPSLLYPVMTRVYQLKFWYCFVVSHRLSLSLKITLVKEWSWKKDKDKEQSYTSLPRPASKTRWMLLCLHSS